MFLVLHDKLYLQKVDINSAFTLKVQKGFCTHSCVPTDSVAVKTITTATYKNPIFEYEYAKGMNSDIQLDSKLYFKLKSRKLLK